jgi:hypothetical protein
MGSTPSPASMLAYEFFDFWNEPLFKPGDIIVVTEKPDVTFVTVDRNLGAIKGVGWLLYTREGNHILVKTIEQQAKNYLQRVVFVTDRESFTSMLEAMAK